MELDKTHCPTCGHEVLDWDFVCPGCKQVPRLSPAGEKLLAHKRRWNTWSTAGPVALILALLAAIVLIGNWNAFKMARWSQEAGTMEEEIERASWYAAMLRQTPRDTPAYDTLMVSVEQWVTKVLPQWLDAIQDREHNPRTRLEAVTTLGEVFGGSSGLADVVVAYREDFLAVLIALLDEDDAAIRVVTIGVLRELGIDAQAEWPSPQQLAQVMDPWARGRVFNVLRARLLALGAHPVHQKHALSSAERAQILDLLVVSLDWGIAIAYGAAGRLAWAGDRRAVPWLIAHVRSPYMEIQQTAVGRLEALSGERFGSDQQAWEQWWDTNQHKEFPFEQPREFSPE